MRIYGIHKSTSYTEYKAFIWCSLYVFLCANYLSSSLFLRSLCPTIRTTYVLALVCPSQMGTAKVSRKSSSHESESTAYKAVFFLGGFFWGFSFCFFFNGHPKKPSALSRKSQERQDKNEDPSLEILHGLLLYPAGEANDEEYRRAGTFALID